MRIIIGIISFVILLFLIFGVDIKHKNVTYDSWSGLIALFQKDSSFGLKRNPKINHNLSSIDGPYIFNNILYKVNSKNELEKIKINKNNSLSVQVDNETLDNFNFKLKRKIDLYPDTYDMPNKLVAISDIEGNFNAFSSFLKNNHVIDDKYNWIFGDGHLVLVGDFVDRGKNVTPILWLIYKLEEQAIEAKGRVHFILGNHEIMNFQGKYKYNADKYKVIAQLIYEKTHKREGLKVNTQSDYTKFLYSVKSELGKWLHSKNGIEKIGDYIFVHGGISPEILNHQLSISQINSISRNHWDKDLYHTPKQNNKANFLLGRKGIFWYRGLLRKYKNYYDKISEQDLNKILSYYKSKKIVIGHTITSDDIIRYFNDKIIAIDVHHGNEKNSKKTKGLLIENGIEYKIDGKGEKSKL